MKILALMLGICILGTVRAGANATPTNSLSYVYQFQKKEYWGRKTFSYPLISITAVRDKAGDLAPTVPVDIRYIGKKGQEIIVNHTAMSVKGCQRARLGERCADFFPDLNLGVYQVSCKVEFTIDGEKKDLSWGQCFELNERPSGPRFEISFEGHDDENRILNLKNIGNLESQPLRILVAYIGSGGEEISYEFRRIETRIQPGQSELMALGSENLRANTCKIKITVDPDYQSEALEPGKNVATLRYGECSSEAFVPYEDLSVGQATVTMLNGSVKIDLGVYNNSDVAVSGRPLDVKIEGFDSEGKPVFRDKSAVTGWLAPKEMDVVMFKVPLFLFQKSCRLEFEVNPAATLDEFNKNNNKSLLNLCH